MEAAKTQYEVSMGKTLLGNWVEERQVAHLDNCHTTIKELHRHGHSNVLTQLEEKRDYNTTCESTYKQPVVQCSNTGGKRRELLERQLYEQISAEVQAEMAPAIPPIDYTTTTKKDFTRDYEKSIQEPTMKHDVKSEMPLTFWQQNLSTMHGVTQVKQDKQPFKKNAAFSTPLSEFKDAPKPGEDWNY